MDMEKKLQELKEYISSYPDFPKPGILFRDMFSLLRNPNAFKDLRDVMVEISKRNIPDAQAVVGLESRGFLFGSVLAIELGLPFVPIRKPGKLPGELNKVTYQLEYGTDTFEIQKDAVTPGLKVLLVDDLLATGGSLKAGCQLIEESGGVVAGCLVIMELVDLRGRDKISQPVFSLLEF
ncbi:Adenine phosphoribosyltransferase [Orchesella cincta]|uniref:Adenine phosphoribosyltransferase n=1 Tax=Orchesella cincta TaxID=48709 RepID=A0A1D2MPJ2_ORCCI|nr:Adenine phosphoribosyltransferase [Orchesella cincta]